MFTMGLEQIAEILGGLEGQAIGVSPQQCTRVRHKNSTCTLCADNCPTHAITWYDKLRIDAATCTGCGICTAVCPTGALEPQAPTDAELLEQIKIAAKSASMPGRVVLACPKTAKRESGAILLNCNGRLDESILVAMIAAGASEIQLVDGACASCPGAAGRAAAGQAVERAMVLLRAFGQTPRITFVSAPPADTTPAPVPAGSSYTRRAFFSMLARETVKATTLTANAVLKTQAKSRPEPVKVGEAAKRVPVKRQLLLEAMRQLARERAPEGASWVDFAVADNCNGCQICAYFCPTGALGKTETDGKRGMTFKAADCTNCGLCEQVCLWGAAQLTLTDLRLALQPSAATVQFPAAADTWPRTTEEKLKRLTDSLVNKT